MEFTATAADLFDVLGLMRTTVPTRTTIPLLNNVYVEAKDGGISLVGTDMTLELSTSQACEVAEDGETTLPTLALFSLVKALPPSKLVTIRVQDGRAKLTCGRSAYSLGTIPVDGFPRMPAPEDDTITISLPVEDFKELIGATKNTTLDNVADRYFLQGICIHTIGHDLVFASLNGKQFAQIRKEMPAGLRDIPVLGSPILPNGFVKAMAAVIATREPTDLARLAIGSRRASFSVGSTTLTGKLIEGQFPEYEKMMPDASGATFQVNAGALGEALSRLSIVYSGLDTKAQATIIGCGKGVIDLTAGKVMGDQGSEVVEAEIIAKAPPFGVSVQLLAQMVAMWPPTATLQVYSENPSAPILITSTDVPNLTHVIMPMTPSAQMKRQVAAEAA